MVDIKACVKGKIGEDALSNEAIDALTNEIEAKAKNIARRQQIGYDEAVAQAVQDQKFYNRVRQLERQHGALINAKIEKSINARLTGFRQEGVTPFLAGRAFLSGIAKNIEDGRFSVDAQYKAAQNKYLGQMVRMMEAEGLLRFAQNKDFEIHIARAYSDLTSKNPKGVEAPKQAKRIAEIVHNTMEALRIQQNKYGANIRSLDGFYGVQYHNAWKIRGQGYSRWKADVINLLDFERMGVLDDEIDDFLKSAYSSITKEGSQHQFGGLDVARKLSESRQLHFKQADGWIEYNSKYGNNNYFESIAFTIDRSARDLTLLKNFGTNPKAMFEKTLASMDGLSSYDQGLLRNIFNEIDGTTAIPVNPRYATVGAVIRGLEIMSKLGSAIFSYTVDVPIKAIALQKAGMGVFDSYKTAYSDVLRPYSPEERILIADAVGVGTEGVIGALGNSFFSIDNVPGMASKATRLFFKLNLQDWWTNKAKMGTSIALSHLHGRYKNTKFDALPDDMKNDFRKYGIGEQEWDGIRASVDTVNGKDYTLIDNIQSEDLADRYRAYLVDIIETATLTPGAYEKSLTNLGQRRGTVTGEVVRLVMQFKSFPITFGNKIWGRAIYGSGKADIPQMMQLVTAMMVASYGAQVLRDAARGRTPPDLTKQEVLTDLFVRSGAGALYADLTLGYLGAPRNTDFVSAIAGPFASDLNDYAALLKAAYNDEKRVTAKAGKKLAESLPGSNLFYLQPALNYIFMNQLKEMASPGYASRIKGYYESKRNQEFFPSALTDPSRTLAEDLR